jgi:hypothetical protein
MILLLRERIQFITNFVSSLKKEFESFGSLTIAYDQISWEHGSLSLYLDCSIIESKSGEYIYYNPMGGFKYVNNNLVDPDGFLISFKVTKSLNEVFKKPLQKNFKQVFKEKASKTWYYPQTIDSPSIGL